jgi:hypothetical protein
MLYGIGHGFSLLMMAGGAREARLVGRLWMERRRRGGGAARSDYSLTVRGHRVRYRRRICFLSTAIMSAEGQKQNGRL